MKWLRGRKFDETEEKSESTKKRNSYCCKQEGKMINKKKHQLVFGILILLLAFCNSHQLAKEPIGKKKIKFRKAVVAYKRPLISGHPQEVKHPFHLKPAPSDRLKGMTKSERLKQLKRLKKYGAYAYGTKLTVANLYLLYDQLTPGSEVSTAALIAVAGGYKFDADTMKENPWPILIKGLNDPKIKESVRATAALVLGKSGRKDVVGPLFGVLRDKQEKVRACAALALGQLGDKRAVDHLLAKPTLASISALGYLGDQRCLEPLWGLLKKSGYTHPRDSMIARAYVRMGKSAADFLIRQLSRGKEFDLVNCIGLLRLMEERRPMSQIRELVGHKRFYVRWAAIWYLGEMGDASAVPQLLNALSDKKPMVRQNAAWALGKIKAPSAIDMLVKVIENKKN
ncbi:MAG: hypothetical protein GF421_00215, partial [Candidatus Aminicenantes bacterium]|nr:hypothetical protein [Candidatus Aminicenantes bacterium]